MGTVKSCNCCDLQPSKAQEVSVASPMNKLSLRDFSGLLSPKGFNKDFDLQVRIRLLQSVNSSKMLKLKVINEGNLPKGTAYIITAHGLKESARALKDGYTYFGCKLKIDNIIVNDIILPISDEELTESQKGQHFLIAYNIDKDSYFIQDLKKGYGPFIKLIHILVIDYKGIKK